MIVAKLDEVGMKLKKKLCEMEIIPGCFVAGTLIKMKGGGYKRIEDIEIGDYVLSYNEDEQTEEYQKVYKTFKNTVSTTLKIKFKNGISVETTLNHLFYLKDTGYVEAWKLEKNNKIFSINKYEEIEEIYEKEYFVKDIYNFSVERNNNYYISELDLLVHNEGESCAEILKKMDGAIKNKNDIYKGTKKSLRKEEYEEIMNACFIDGTKVFSKDNLKIDEIEKGDFVYSYNFEKEKIEEKEVLTIFKSRVDRIIKLTLKNIETNLIEDIETTLEHLFYTNGNYKLAKYLKVGDELKSFNNETIEIINVETKKLEKEIFVYNFEVEGNHNYFVGENGILVHNEKEFFDENNLDKLFDGEKLTPLGRELKDNKPKGSPEIKEWIERHSENNPKKYNKGGFFAVSDDRTKYLYGWDDNGDITLGMVDVNDGYTTISGHIGDPIKVPYASRNHNRDFGKFAEDIRENTKKIIEKDGINLAESKNEIYLKLTQSDKDDIIDYLREEGIVIHHARDNRDFDYTFEMQETKRHNANKGGVAHKGPQALDGMKRGE